VSLVAQMPGVYWEHPITEHL